MPNPKSYSRIAIAVSAALTSMVFSAHAAWIDVDSLPSSGLVSSLSPELQALFPAQANASFAKTSATPNYVYQWSAGTIPVFGNGLTLNGPGAEAFEHSITVIQNSATGSPGVIFGDDLTIRTQSKNAANNGKDVDGIRTHGANTPDNPVFIITGDRTSIYVDGQDGDGINAGYNSYSQGWKGSANIYVGDDLYIQTTGYQGRGITANAMKDATQAKNTIVVGDRAHIVTIGDSSEGLRTGQSGSSIRLGDDATIETSGASSTGIYAASSSKTELGNNATITVNGVSAHAVYSTNATVNLGENATINVNNSAKAASFGQKSPIFKELKEKGYLLKRPDGSLWQWDKWQPGLAIYDFTNPQACEWYANKLKGLMDIGVDCFKTDFGERIPTDVQWFDGADPQKMHNHYAYIYNELVWNVLKETVGEEEAVLFARSASVGAQQFPVHWGGDCYANYESMAESLRGGLSIGLSGFGFWSHDIGGFENTAPAHVYKRWCAFGLLSSHSRLHGSKSYRVPWAYDGESCDVVRYFTEQKCRMMPYLYREAARANELGTPMMRAMMLEFPDDPACDYLDRQYMLGDSVMVAPVFSEAGDVQFYLPEGRWTHLWRNDEVSGSRWHKQQHGFLSLPVYVRENTLLALGSNNQKPDYAWHEGTAFQLFHLQEGREAVCEVPAMDGSVIFTLKATRVGNTITVKGNGEARNWTLCLRNIQEIGGIKCGSHMGSELGVVITPQGSELTITL